MKVNAIKFIENYIGEPANYISAIFSVIITALTLTFRKYKIEIWILGACVIFLLIVIWGLIIALFNEKKRNRYSIIQLEIRYFFINTANKEMLLLEGNDILSLDVFVDIFYTERDTEELIAVGKVVNIQQNELQQVEIVHWYTDDDVKDELLHNNFNYIKRIAVKPKFKKDGGYEDD